VRDEQVGVVFAEAYRHPPHLHEAAVHDHILVNLKSQHSVTMTKNEIMLGVCWALPVAFVGTYDNAVGVSLVLDGQHSQAVVVFT